MSNKNIYMKNILSHKLYIDYNNLNSNIDNLLENNIKKNIEGKCINEGYVKVNSVKLISYSCGELFSNYTIFDVVFECLISLPSESMILECVINSKTKIGIRCELSEEISPYLIFVARDHNYDNEKFSKLEVGEKINVRVIGYRFELNDTFISIIAELIDNENDSENTKKISKKLSKSSTLKKN